MAPPYTVLISGANRGLGKGLLTLYLAKPNHVVIAFNRDPTSSSSKALFDLPRGADTRLIVAKSDASVESDPAAAVAEIERQGVAHLDLVIANAGVSYSFPLVRDLEIADLQAHLVPNVFGVVKLFQATRALLLKAAEPKWATMGSSAGWLENQHPIRNSAYGPTKAAVHWLTKRIDGEEEQIAAWVLDPGWVQTDMGNAGAQALGVGTTAPLELDVSVTGMEKVISVATKQTHGGKLWGHDGKQQVW